MKPAKKSNTSRQGPSRKSLLQNARDAEKAQRLARIRHELRTPINHIIGYSELLLDEEDLPRAFVEDLNKIRAGGRRLLQLIAEYFNIDSPAQRSANEGQIYHELRTPVNQIIGYSELLQEQAQEQRRDRIGSDLQKIHQAARTWLAQAEHHLLPSNSPEGAKSRAVPPRPAQRAIEHSTGISAPAAEPGKLLVVDDDASNRDLLARRLQSQGHQVVTAETGRQALKLLRQEKFDLVLLDVLMPLIPGSEVLAEMKGDPELRHIPVIMISALDDTAEVVRCIQIGAEDYVGKPFDSTFLRARVGAALEKKRLRDREHTYLQELEIEQKRSEDLLLNILPKPIADRLKAGQEIIADFFPEATVMFADLVGFTSYSLQVSASELVDVLNEIFSVFDGLAAQLGLEKIKTIGDAYMVVGGVPLPRPDHAETIATLALQMQQALEAFNQRYHTTIQIRIGVNTGPVIAGVIGRKKFSYDLWGDTVNTASRMESHSTPGKIQVSASTFARIRDKFRLIPRGKIEIKGLGPMETWYLEGLPIK